MYYHKGCVTFDTDFCAERQETGDKCLYAVEGFALSGRLKGPCSVLRFKTTYLLAFEIAKGIA